MKNGLKRSKILKQDLLDAIRSHSTAMLKILVKDKSYAKPVRGLIYAELLRRRRES